MVYWVKPEVKQLWLSPNVSLIHVTFSSKYITAVIVGTGS